MNKDGHCKVSFVNQKFKGCLMVNDKKFKELNKLTEDVAEVVMGKHSIVQDTPIQLGKFILDYAKLRMLQFYYDFLDYFIDRKHWEYAEMDTDSAYFAVSADEVNEQGQDVSLESLVKDDLKEQFEEEKDTWLVTCTCGDGMCTNEDCDKRTPGKFKLEYLS